MKKKTLSEKTIKEFKKLGNTDKDIDTWYSLNTNLRRKYYVYARSFTQGRRKIPQKPMPVSVWISNRRIVARDYEMTDTLLSLFHKTGNNETDIKLFNQVDKKYKNLYAGYLHGLKRGLKRKIPTFTNWYYYHINKEKTREKDLEFIPIEEVYKKFGKKFTDKTLHKFEKLMKQTFSEEDVEFYLNM